MLGVDGENPYDIVAMNAASARHHAWPGCRSTDRSASVRMGLIDGQWVVNPTFQETRGGDVRRRRRRPPQRAGRDRHPDDRGRGARQHVGAARRRRHRAHRGDVAEGLEAAKARDRRGHRLPAASSSDAVGVTRAAVGARAALRRRRLRARSSAFAKDRARRGHRARQGRARGEARRAEGRGEGAPGVRRWATTPPRARASSVPAWKQLQKKVMRKRVIDEGIRLDGRTADRHPAALGRGRRAQAGARLGAVQPGRHAGAERDDAGHAPDDADDRHARPRGQQAVHAPLQLPAATPPARRAGSARRAAARSATARSPSGR